MGNYAAAEPLYRQALDIKGTALGEDHPDFAISLNNLALLHNAMGNYAEAEPLFWQASNIWRAALGEDHPAYATSLRNLAELYHNMGNNAEAEPLYRQAVEIDRIALGEDHPDFAADLNNLAEFYRVIGNYAAAEPLYRQALKIKQTTLGEDHPSFASSLNNLAELYSTMGNYAEAEPLYWQALEIDRKALGETHPDFATDLSCLAGLYESMGNYAEAEPLYRQASDIWRTALGEHHPAFATSLNNLAELYRNTGNYAEAEHLNRQALAIDRKALGESHPGIATDLNNLAALYYAMGDYAAAEPRYRQALEITRTALGEAHPQFAGRLNNLALLHDAMGNYAAAEPLFRQATDILRVALGEDHPLFAASLSNLAGLYESAGNCAAAQPLFRQALEIRRKALGEDHPEFAQSLNNLAALYDSMGDYTAAEPLHRHAIDIARVALGEDHPHFACTLHNLAALYESMGDYTAAEPLYRQASDIWRTALGENHPNYATGLNNMAGVYVATIRTSEAQSLMLQAAAIDDRMIGQVFSIGSGSQRTAFLKMVRANVERFLSLVWRHLGEAPDAIRAALDLVLRRKAIGAESLAAQRDALLGGKYPTLEPQVRELTTLRRQIAQKTLAGAGPEGLPAHRQLLVQWDQQKERLEAELAHRIPEMNLEQKLRAADRRAVALALPAGVALVEFVRFDVYDFEAVPARGESRWQPARYLAFVLPAGEPDHVQMIDLGEAEAIDRLIRDFRAGITGEAEEHAGLNLARRRATPVPAEQDSAGQALRAALFDPLTPALGGCTRLLLAPEGDLSRLPFEVLPTADGHYLIDCYQISYLATGRDVLRFGAAASGQATAPLVIADPNFDLAGAATPAPLETASVPGRGSHDLDRRQGELAPAQPLPGTCVEGEQISGLLKESKIHMPEGAAEDVGAEAIARLLAGTRLWLGEMALEGQLKRDCRSPYILHLATHGYFLTDQPRDPNRYFRGLGAAGGQTGEGMGRLSGQGLENPLLRSWLVLAGFNTWLRQESPAAQAEDGLLTAEDVTGLDLLDTELVVLSACETGLGQVHVGEGVFGLRRAFVLAGAKTLVMSLWKVPDQQTQELMVDFYQRILAGEPRAEALRQAQLALKSRYPDPRDWGAFICQGEPGPLRMR